MFDIFWRELRHSARALRRTPGFSLVAVLTLGLGIGANSAVFSIVSAVLARPLPYPNPQELRLLTTRFDRQGLDQFWVSPPEYFELVEGSQSFSVIGAYRTTEANLAADDRPRRVITALVNAELLEALRVPPALGRTFRRDETLVSGSGLAILSHDLWQSAFAGRADIIGKTVDVNGIQREIIGVMPRGFDVMDQRVALLLPLPLNPANRGNRGNHFLTLIGRLKPGVGGDRAAAELASLMTNWGERFGVGDHTFSVGDHVLQIETLDDEIVGSARRAIWVLQGAVAFVLLIACSNFANLLLARSERRRREVGLRVALGASRSRLMILFGAEGVLLSVVGGLIGIGLAWLGLNALLTTYPESLPRAADIALDRQVLGFTVLLSVVIGLVFGLAPLFHLPGSAVSRMLLEQGARHTGGRRMTRHVLVVTEIALAAVLVIGAGLMLGTVRNLTRVDVGFDQSQLVTFGIQLPVAKYRDFQQGLRLYERLLEGLDGVSGVSGVAAMSGLPPQREVNANGTDVEGFVPSPEAPRAVVDYYQTVTGDYFDVMRIPIVQGRAFEPTDRGGAPVAIVNETFARRFWKDADPIGRRIRPRFGPTVPWLTVVGVARDVKQASVDQPAGTELYFLLDQLPRVFPGAGNAQLGAWEDGSMKIVLRSGLSAATLQPAIDGIVRQADSSLPIIRLRQMEEVIRDSVRRPVMLLHLLSGFATIALLLAAIGIYGVLSFIVAERRREIGIRVALGARPQKVLRDVVFHGLALAGVGLAIGLGAALVLTKLLAALLFGIQPSDGLTFVSVAVAIGFVAMMASLVPGYRAIRIDPIIALKTE